MEEVKMMDDENYHTKGTVAQVRIPTIFSTKMDEDLTKQTPATGIRKDSEVLLEELDETFYSSPLSDISEKPLSQFTSRIAADVKLRNAKKSGSTATLTSGKEKRGKTFDEKLFLKTSIKSQRSYSGIIGGRVKKMKMKSKKYKIL